MEQKQNVLRLVSLFTLILVICVSCSKKDSARIQVKINGIDNKIAVLQEQKVTGIKILDTINISGKGKFNYTFKVKQPGFFNIKIPGRSTIYLLLFPEDKVKISADNNIAISNLKIEGSPDSEKLNILYDSLFSARKILETIRSDYDSALEPIKKEEFYNSYVKTLDDYRKFSMQFVLDNLQSLTSVAALYQEIGPGEFVFGRKRDLQFFKLTTDTLIKYYPKHPHVRALQQNYNQLMASLQFEIIKNKVGEIGVGLPELILPTFSGELVSLNSTKERYVLLNFWQNNDAVSNQLFPGLNAVFNKHHTKNFNIYNVYLGKSPALWRQIVKFEEIDKWINVADTAFPYSQTRMLYNVVAIPSNYLIDFKEKVILAKDIAPQQLNQILTDATN